VGRSPLEDLDLGSGVNGAMMSWQASQWAIKQRTGSGPAKTVLMILAEAAGVQDAACFLSHDTIAERAELSPRAVWAQMQHLARLGLISRTRRIDGRGHRTSDLITIALTATDATRDETQPAAGASRTETLTARRAIPYSHVVQSLPARRAEEPISEPVNEPKEDIFSVRTEPSTGKPALRLKGAAPTDQELAEFEEFYGVYPRKEKRKEAKEAFVRARRAGGTHNLIMAGGLAYRGARAGKDPNYTALASSWLNGERWTDEIAPHHDAGAPECRSPMDWVREGFQ